MTQKPDRLDRIEATIEGLAQRQEASQEETEALKQRQETSQTRTEALEQRQEAFQAEMEMLKQRQEATQAQIDAQLPVVAELRASTIQLRQSTADLSATAEALLATVNIHQDNFNVIVGEIREMRTDIRLILDYLRDRNDGGSQPG